MRHWNFWISATMVVGVLVAFRMFLFANSAPPPITDGRLWFILILAVLGTMLWAYVRQRHDVFLGAVAVIVVGAILSPTPMLWPLGALAIGAALFARPRHSSG
ncbi:MAG: hypothetical protein M0Z53_05435 [Thermaerobacter sp.]|nr:hypothetical protein [Thermaerobacter sp.]